MDKPPSVKNLSPLRYPGSKKRFFAHFSEIIKYNELKPAIFIEPFVGGGNIFLNLLANKLANKVIISDKDKLIYSFWKEVFLHPKRLVGFINKVKVDLATFNKYKDIAINSSKHSLPVLAKACLFLNRTSFSGILTNDAGPLGGREQESPYRIDCRFNRKNLVEKIKCISTFKSKVKVLPYDWEQVIKHIKTERVKRKIPRENILFYFDPPFFNKAPHLYRCYFSDINHKQFCNEVSNLKYNWVLSYDNAPEIKKLYSNSNNCRKMHIEMPYSINSHSKRLKKELIITPLKLPRLHI